MAHMTESQRFNNTDRPRLGSPSVWNWYTVDSDMHLWRLSQGWLVAFEPLSDASSCIDGEMYLFKTPAGALFLGEFRRLACGYEAVQHEGTPMGSEQHGVTVVGEYRGCMK